VQPHSGTIKIANKKMLIGFHLSFQYHSFLNTFPIYPHQYFFKISANVFVIFESSALFF